MLIFAIAFQVFVSMMTWLPTNAFCFSRHISFDLSCCRCGPDEEEWFPPLGIVLGRNKSGATVCYLASPFGSFGEIETNLPSMTTIDRPLWFGYVGNWIAGFSGNCGSNTNMATGLFGIYHGLNLAGHKGFCLVICESDSKMALQFIEEGVVDCHPHAPLVAAIRLLMGLNWDVSFLHTFREGNFCADALAELGATNTSPLFLSLITALLQLGLFC
ncbi:hypothetical protein JHK87_049522 [Glycine soja]|nr:hypothetical protein JHK87_049522 [Glycine soja]